MCAAEVLCYVVVFAQICAVTLVSGLTNAEFYDLVKDNISDVEELDPHDDVIEEDDDVISLRGGPDDEIDVEYIADKLGLTKPDKASHKVGGLHHRYQHNPSFSCHCHLDSCSCCLIHTFKVNLIFKTIKFRLHACVTVAYLPRNYGFGITFTINGHRLFHKELSLRNPPALCFGVPGLRRFARICLQFYNFNFRTKRICVRLAGILDLKIKKFRAHLKLGCFKIPILDQQVLTSFRNDRDFLHVSAQASDDETEEVEQLGYIASYKKTTTYFSYAKQHNNTSKL